MAIPTDGVCNVELGCVLGACRISTESTEHVAIGHQSILHARRANDNLSTSLLVVFQDRLNFGHSRHGEPFKLRKASSYLLEKVALFC